MALFVRRHLWLSWSVAVFVPAAFVLLFGFGHWSTVVWGSPRTLFWTVSSAAIGAIALTGYVATQGWSRRRAEVGLLGSGLAALSMLLLVHGLTAPGVFYGTNNAVATSVFVGVPLALLMCIAIVFPDTSFSRTIARHWRGWSLALLAAAAAIAGVMLVAPNAIPAPPGPHSLFTRAVVAVCIFAALRISIRHVRLFEVGQRGGSLVGAISMAQLGTVMLVFILPSAFSPGFWLAHVIGFAAVFAGSIGVMSAYLENSEIDEIAEPILERDPLIALELGLSPEIQAFVDALEKKDVLTREHVIRVADLAMRVGARAGLSDRELRTLGLGALLHDIGKLVVPDDILKKPAGLTDEEYTLIKSHPLDGAEMMDLASPALRPVAPLVRWHHERWDGKGYPDQIGGADLPLAAQIVSVCDAWDAMTALRVYRDAMPIEKAQAIMLEGAGKQWNAACVELLLEETSTAPAPLDDVFRNFHRPASLDDLAECCAH
jgi:HD-GYP domain-containing protein (c-di-GMP phosphodiesterase class II)